MRHTNFKSFLKGVLWEAIGVTTALGMVYLFVNSRESAYLMVLILPFMRIATWCPYEQLFERGWRKLEVWLNKKETENADTETK